MLVKETHVSGTVTSTSRAAATTDTVGAAVVIAMGIIYRQMFAHVSVRLACLACCVERSPGERVGETCAAVEVCPTLPLLHHSERAG